jgi:predicted Co/Zn/Cd cation transporter (cation efflux family)
VDRGNAAYRNHAPSPEERLFCGISRRGLKIYATITSLCALAVYAIAVALNICHDGCTRGLLILALVLAIVSIFSCTGLCVTARSHGELGESTHFFCGCQKKYHDVLSMACLLGLVFFFLVAPYREQHEMISYL